MVLATSRANCLEPLFESATLNNLGEKRRHEVRAKHVNHNVTRGMSERQGCADVARVYLSNSSVPGTQSSVYIVSNVRFSISTYILI